MKYRTRFEITSAILAVAREGKTTKTRLMYASFLSFAQINEYLSFLLANQLIAKEKSTRMYALTDKGMRFLHAYEELNALLQIHKPIPALLEVAA